MKPDPQSDVEKVRSSPGVGHGTDDSDLHAPIRTVLVPTDFSSGAQFALGRALLLPLAAGARIHLVHVLPAGERAETCEKATAISNRRLAQLAAQARKDGAVNPTITFGMLTGAAFVEIVRCARDITADLIVIGRHGRRPLKDAFIGSTADRVIRKGDVPVLAVKVKPKKPYRKPIIATDFADASRRAFELALRVLGPEVTNIELVNAFDVPFEGFVTPVYSAREKSGYRKEYREKAQAGLKAFLAQYDHVNMRWRPVVRAGDARTVVLGETVRRRADLVALGTHARSGVSHALLGSVAEWVIAAAPCDVLVARPIRFSFQLP